jgi:hypothetical protein
MEIYHHEAKVKKKKEAKKGVALCYNWYWYPGREADREPTWQLWMARANHRLSF